MSTKLGVVPFEHPSPPSMAAAGGSPGGADAAYVLRSLRDALPTGAAPPAPEPRCGAEPARPRGGSDDGGSSGDELASPLGLWRRRPAPRRRSGRPRFGFFVSADTDSDENSDDDAAADAESHAAAAREAAAAAAAAAEARGEADARFAATAAADAAAAISLAQALERARAERRQRRIRVRPSRGV